MKAITRLHPRKTQHHVHNCLHLISCCGAKWCIMSIYTSTFNNNIWHALQRVGQLLHGWTLLSWFLANSPEKLDTACQAFPLIHCWSCSGWCWAFNLHWVNWVCRGFTLRSGNPSPSAESPDPSLHSFGISPLVQNAFFPIATVPSNIISMDLTFGKGLFLKVNALGHAYMWTTGS